MTRRKRRTNSKQWFQFAVGGKKTGWKKSLSPKTRREKMLQAKRHNYLRAARALQALANVTKDPATKRAARSDAQYFYRLYRSKKGR